MKNRFRFQLRGTGAAIAVACALSLGACNPPASNTATAADNATATDGNMIAFDNASDAALPDLPATLPLQTGAASAPTAAPAVSALPAARPIGAVQVANTSDAYAYADDAASFGQAIGDAPPDYGFDYAGVEPYAWQGSDNSASYAEPVAGGYRYYYYRPGADQPYFVRDPDYAYGYDGGQLAVIYDRDGRVVPYNDYGPRLDYASRYYDRGRALYAASRQRRAVVASNWAQRQPAVVGSRQRWAALQDRQSDWRAYHQRVAPREQAHWQQERDRRQADAQRFAAWQDDGYRTPPPPRAIPANWQQAKWARDDRHYQVVPQQQDARQRQDVARQQQAAAQQQRDAQHQQRQANREQQAQRQQQTALDRRQAAQNQRQAQHDKQQVTHDQQQAARDRQQAQAQAQQAARQHDAARQQQQAADAAKAQAAQDHARQQEHARQQAGQTKQAADQHAAAPREQAAHAKQAATEQHQAPAPTAHPPAQRQPARQPSPHHDDAPHPNRPAPDAHADPQTGHPDDHGDRRDKR